MYIENASLQDLQEILELQYIAYQSEAKLLKNWDIPPLKQTLSEVQEEYRKGIILKLIDEKNTIVGSVRGYLENHTVFIGKLMVHPEKQRQGLGKKLLLAMEKEYPNERYELFTSTMSKRNIEFYEKLGYRIFEEKKITEELVFVYLEKSCRNIREVDEMNYKESIEKTKQGFEASFQADAFYNKQTKDEKHLELILNFLKVQPGMKILDLGTGTGYLAFPLAKKYPKTDVT